MHFFRHENESLTRRRANRSSRVGVKHLSLYRISRLCVLFTLLLYILHRAFRFIFVSFTFEGNESTDNVQISHETLIPSNSNFDATPHYNTSQANEGVQGTQALLNCANTLKGDGANEIRNIAYWRDVPSDNHLPQELIDMAFLGPSPKYVSFEADQAGWNNKRLSMETILIFASLTRRTLVMPPEQRIYQLDLDKSNKMLEFEDFFPLEKISELGRLNIISTEEFFRRESAGQNNKDRENLKIVLPKKASQLSATEVSGILERVAGQFEGGLPSVKPGKQGFVFPYEAGTKVNMTESRYRDDSELSNWLAGREVLEYDEKMQSAPLIHWRFHEARLLTPFYAFSRHSKESVNRYHKRMIRDTVHYRDEVFCKASQIISLLQRESKDGNFSTFHIRRGDFYLDKIKLSAEKMVSMSKAYLNEGELLFIATDEKDKSFFDPLKEVYTVRFLDDYWKKAELDELSNKNFVSLVDSVIASHGRTFTGTWFSTFSSYILRMRGYLGHPRDSNWYFHSVKQKHAHLEQWPKPPFWMTEWYQGWENIDME